MERANWRRTSLGTRLSASRRALLPAVTARPTRLDRLDRDDARLFAAMPQPPYTKLKLSAMSTALEIARPCRQPLSDTLSIRTRNAITKQPPPTDTSTSHDTLS